MSGLPLESEIRWEQLRRDVKDCRDLDKLRHLGLHLIELSRQTRIQCDALLRDQPVKPWKAR